MRVSESDYPFVLDPEPLERATKACPVDQPAPPQFERIRRPRPDVGYVDQRRKLRVTEPGLMRPCSRQALGNLPLCDAGRERQRIRWSDRMLGPGDVL